MNEQVGLAVTMKYEIGTYIGLNDFHLAG